MQELLDLIRGLNISPDKMQELASAAKDNPFAAFSKVQELGIPPEVLQKLMLLAMSNPNGLVEVAKQFGADDSMIETLQGNLNSLKKD